MANKLSLTKGRSVFMVDLSLILVFMLLIYSGLMLHVTSHITNHAEWEYWAEYHSIVGLVSLVLGWLHIKAHWNWYKGLFKNGIGKRSKVTVVVSILFLVLIVTGLILIFFVNGGNSPIGLWHYRFGLAIALLLIVHTAARFPLLTKGLGAKKPDRKSSGMKQSLIR